MTASEALKNIDMLITRAQEENRSDMALFFSLVKHVFGNQFREELRK